MKRFLLAVLSAVTLLGQATLAPPPQAQFFSNTGSPLSNGTVTTFVAGTTTLVSTWSDASGTVANSNPVVLNAAGRANIWLLNGLAYKFIIQDQFGSTISTVDNITGSGSGSGGGGAQWTTNGISIYNSNSGNVGIGCVSPLQKLSVCGGSSSTNLLLRIDDAANNPGLNLYASGLKQGTWSADSAAALRVRGQADAAEFLVGQSGTSVLPQVGFLGFSSSGDAAGGAPDACIGHNASGVLEIDTCASAIFADLILRNLSITGTCTGCGGGGGGAVSSVTGTAHQVIATPTTGAVVLTTPQAIDTSSSVVFQNVTAGNTTTPGVIQAVSGPGSTSVFQITNGAGSPTINWSVDGNGDVSADGNQVTTGYVTSGVWFGLHPLAACTAPAPGGGYSAIHYKSGGSGDIICLYNVTSSSWVAIDLASVAGGLTSINGQTGPAITFAGTAHEVIATTSANTVTLSTPQAIDTTSNVAFGSVQAGVSGGSIGFSTNDGSAHNYFLVDGQGNVSLGCPTGGAGCGVLAVGTSSSGSGGVNVTGTAAAKNSIQSTGGFNAGSAGGANGAYQMNGVTVIDNNRNAAVVNLTVTGTCTGCASGAVSSLTGTANQVLANGTSGVPTTGAITLSLPQNINTSANVSFASVTTSGVHQSSGVGGSITFQNTNFNFQVDGNGNGSFAGNLNMTGAGSIYQMSGSTVINHSGAFVGGGGVNTTAGGTFGSALVANGGISQNISTNSTLSAGSGSWYMRPVAGNGISCFGVQDGWFAGDNVGHSLLMCLGGNRYKVDLTAY